MHGLRRRMRDFILLEVDNLCLHGKNPLHGKEIEHPREAAAVGLQLNANI